MHYISALLFLLWPSCGALQVPFLGESNSSPKSPFSKEFDGLAADLLERWHVPGLAIAVVDGEDTFSKGYGIERFPSSPVTPNTLFFTGSTTKSFTAAAISLLIDDNANTSNPLTWQNPLVSHLREDFVLKDEWATTHTTLEDALSHRTGQPRHDLAWMDEQASLSSVIQRLRHLPMTAEPRTKFQYCNMMFVTLSHFLEKVTSTRLGDFLRTRIYGPLSMSSTFFSLRDAETAVATGKVSLAKGYFWANHTQEYLPLEYMTSTIVSGAGATISTVLDYATWVRCLMNMSAPISRSGHEALRSPRIFISPEDGPETGFRGPVAYALGLFVWNYRGEILIGHGGGVPGFGTNMFFLPRLNWGIVMMANTVESGIAVQNVLIYKLIDDLLRVPEKERYDWAAKGEKAVRQAAQNLLHAKEMLYPNVPDPVLEKSLPLHGYAGVYTHPAYATVNLSIINAPPCNQCEARDDGTEGKEYLTSQFPFYALASPIFFWLEHVSADYFLLYTRYFSFEGWDPRELRTSTDAAIKAEFRIGEDGRVREMGVDIEPEMGGKKIWWTKVG